LLLLLWLWLLLLLRLLGRSVVRAACCAFRRGRSISWRDLGSS
jgi:hypothetical protein